MSNIDNNFIDPNHLDPNKSRLTKTSDYGSYDVSSEYNSATLSTPSTFENQSFYSSSTNTINTFDTASTPSTVSGWKTNDKKESGNQSPVRESLEKRISNLLRKNCVGMVAPFFPDSGNNHQDPNFSPLPHILNNHEHTFHRRNSQKRIDDSDAILGTPPSPFVSASEYLKWHQVTKEIDNKDSDKNQTNDMNAMSVKKRHSQDGHNDNNVDYNDDDDDDRMSLSSLSSGDNKFEDNSVITNHHHHHHHTTTTASMAGTTMNYNDLSTMMAQWNSSTATAATNAYNPITNSLFPPFMYHSFTAQPAFSFFNSFITAAMPSMPSLDLNDIRSRIARSNEDILKELLDDTLKASIKDLKEILRKDIYKKIVENFSFKMFDQWWEDSERKYHHHSSDHINAVTGGDHENKVGERPLSPFKLAEIHLPFLTNPIFENSIQNRSRHQINSSNLEYGVSRGLRAAMGKLPSFKRKIIKPKSPIDDKLSDISDEDDLDNRRTIRRRPHQRIPHHRRKRSSISSESLPSRHHRRHRSDISESSSASSSSSSESSSSSSGSSSSSSSSSGSESESASSSSSSSESSSGSSDEESEDENGSSASVSGSVSAEEESGSESDASGSSSSSSAVASSLADAASVASSILSKKSQTTKSSTKSSTLSQ